MAGQEHGEPLRGVDGAVGVVLGRAAVQLTGVQFVELPLHADSGGPYELRLQADDFAPAHAGVALGDAGHELVVAPGQQSGPFADQQDAERVGDHLLRPAVARAASPLAPASALGGRVDLAQPLLDRVAEDQVQGAAPGLDAGRRIAALALQLHPGVNVELGDRADLSVVELREQVLLYVAAVVLHGRGGQVLAGVPAAGVLAEGDLAAGRVVPPAAADLGFLLFSGLLGSALGTEAHGVAVLVREGAVLPGSDLVSSAPVVAALLAVSQLLLLLLRCRRSRRPWGSGTSWSVPGSEAGP
nr:hypothetical protein [Streptacidiphilus jeojiense]